MTLRYKLISAASGIAMAMAIGAAQAGELLTNEELDTVMAGAGVVVAGAGGSAVAGASQFLAPPAVLQATAPGPLVVTATSPVVNAAVVAVQ